MSGKKDAGINSILGSGSEIVGDFTSKGSARVDGCINGNVKVTGTLTLGASGIINGNVEADTAIIGGEVFGNVFAQERAELTGTAKVLGDISTQTIVIDENAVFQGKCDMNQEIPDARKRRAAAVKAARAGRKTAKAAIQEALKEVEEAERKEALEGAGTTYSENTDAIDSL